MDPSARIGSTRGKPNVRLVCRYFGKNKPCLSVSQTFDLRRIQFRLAIARWLTLAEVLVLCEVRSKTADSRRCVKCAGDHGKNDCPATGNASRQHLKCALCGGAHTANWNLCMVRQREIDKIKNRQTRVNDNRRTHAQTTNEGHFVQNLEASQFDVYPSRVSRHMNSQGHKQEVCDASVSPPLSSAISFRLPDNDDSRNELQNQVPMVSMSKRQPSQTESVRSDCGAERKYVRGTALS